MTNLAIFDLDGTLLASQELDTECFAEAFLHEFGCIVDRDWSLYQHCTDPAITREALSQHFDRPATEVEIERLKTRFEGLLESRFAEASRPLAEVDGASSLLAYLDANGWHVCIATGAWSFSARLKLEAAGVTKSLPLFSSDLHETREGIIGAAIRDMQRGDSPASYDRIVSIGDARWDVRTARHLGLPFLGVGTGSRADLLRSEGATSVVGNFVDSKEITALLNTALPPLP